MALILYTPKGLKELLIDLAEQFDKELEVNNLLASVEIEINPDDETHSLDIRSFSAAAVDDYAATKQKAEDRMKQQETANRIAIVRDGQ
ncbi:MAG TPA: hypothetical protein VGF75_02970 [Candidatus Saccharimonadales bacterium]